LKTATPIALYDSRFIKGNCVIAKNQYGKGTVYYVGSVVEDKVASTVLSAAMKSAGIELVAVSENELLELTEVGGQYGKYMYAINFSNQNQVIKLLKPMTDALTNEKLIQSCIVKPMDYRLLKIE
jgi:beta-galactosidase